MQGNASTSYTHIYTHCHVAIGALNEPGPAMLRRHADQQTHHRLFQNYTVAPPHNTLRSLPFRRRGLGCPAAVHSVSPI